MPFLRFAFGSLRVASVTATARTVRPRFQFARAVPPLRIGVRPRIPTAFALAFGVGVVSSVSVTGMSAVVIKTGDLENLRDFYSLFGLVFVSEKHGSGPAHYSTSLPNGVVFEIYPLPKPKPNPNPNSPAAAAPPPPPLVADSTTRLSFTVSDLDGLMASLARVPKLVIVSLPAETEFGRSAVVRDLDGRSVELVQQQQTRIK